MAKDKEEWKGIEDFPNYEISNHGRVKSLEHSNILTPHISRGYYHVRLHDYELSKTVNIHKLVGEYFVPNPENKAIVNHEDKNKLNNYYKNLKWMSQSDNALHSYYHGEGDSRLTPVIKCDLAGEELQEYRSRSEAVRKTGVSRSNIASNLSGRTKTAGGFIWKYKNK